MPEWTRQEIQERFNIPSNYFSVYKQRGKVIINENGKIDDRNPTNAEFINKMIEKHQEEQKEEAPKKGKKKRKGGSKKREKKKEPEPVSNAEEPTVVTPEEPDTPEIDSEALTPENSEGSSKQDLDKQSKALDIKSKQEEIELKRIKKRRQMGEIIPVDVVKQIFSQHFRNAVNAFEEAAENAVEEFASRKSMTDKEKAEMRGQITRIVNDRINKIADVSLEDVDDIVETYSETLERGESKTSS